MTPPLPQFIFMVVAALLFMHFLVGGSRTFVFNSMDGGGVFAEISFFSGAAATLATGLYRVIDPWAGVAATTLLICALLLYEWARRTVGGYRFHVTLSHRVPEKLCTEGPYSRIRHPFYMSYILAFSAMCIAFRTIPTLIVLTANAGFYIYAALSDERSLAASPLAQAYATYKERTGRFLPRLRQKR